MAYDPHCLDAVGLPKHARCLQSRLPNYGDRPYCCDVCGKSFYESVDLTKHRRMHTGEKPYHCDICGTSFSISSNLTKHKRTHTGEKPYRCDVCDKSFSAADNLKTHKRIHTEYQMTLASKNWLHRCTSSFKD
ncbi:zinc finger protein 22-like [Octopus bimaculoides]|uniref:zinc finger protein 22-like n=1 Tax=Octopus bimaculoides TaxID=37653 RepID=UPI0022E85ECB|nr:zinc finger protein 22-like [Octopus bimaculoides]